MVIGVFLGLGLSRFDGAPTWSKILANGIGTATGQTVITGGMPLPFLAVVVLTNVPQLLLSLIYFSYNSLLTTIAAANEWSQFAVTRKPLRVSSSPRGAQRSSHLLQLPYRLAIPLMITSTVLHWLTSQAIFLADVDAIPSSPPIPSRTWELATETVNNVTGHFSTCGYSPFAIILLMIFGITMILVLVVVSRTRFSTGMPVVGNCSAAISAACHGGSKGEDMGEAVGMPVMWGEVEVEEADGTVRRRCAFSSREVKVPVEGRVYPGEGGDGPREGGDAGCGEGL